MTRTRLLVVAGLLLALVVAGLWWWGQRDDEPGIPLGPSGTAFYVPEDGAVADGPHGSVIWRQPVVGTGALDGASTDLVLYRSTAADGEPTAVSGLVTVPDGPVPEGGWPVISWAHGTTGMADDCAPSRASLGGQTRIYSTSMDGLVQQYVDRGYAVVRTDYEGLGTPGPHPYLMGESEGAAVTDIVLAAHDLHPGALSQDWVAAGHSQGGQAALFASRFADTYAGETRLVGVVALAPPSQMATVLDMVTDGEPMASSAFIGPMVHSAAVTAGVEPASVISADGMDLVPHLEERCITELSARDSLGGMSTGDFLKDGADHSRVRQMIATNDVASLNPGVPVLIAHGTQDELVPSLLTDRLSEQYEAKGADVTVLRVRGANHISVLEESRDDVDEWLRERLPATR